jgi:hypothetical protein
VKTYEFKIIHLPSGHSRDDRALEILNAMGANGWRVVQCFDFWSYLLERERPEVRVV